MIKPIKIDPLNMSEYLAYKCNKCGDTREMHVQKFNMENWEEQYKQNQINCFNCGAELSII